MTVQTVEKNQFLTVLSELQGGGTMADLQMKLAELVDAIRTHGKPGSLTFTLKITPKSNSPQLLFEDDVKVKLPEAERETTILYADDHNHISRRDPRQPELKHLHEARPALADVTVNRTTGEITEP